MAAPLNYAYFYEAPLDASTVTVTPSHSVLMIRCDILSLLNMVTTQMSSQWFSMTKRKDEDCYFFSQLYIVEVLRTRCSKGDKSDLLRL